MSIIGYTNPSQKMSQHEDQIDEKNTWFIDHNFATFQIM